MYLLLAILAALIGVAFSSGNLWNVPFAQLTIGMLVGNLVAAGLYLGAAYLTFRSLAEDRIWPWRWTLAILGNFSIRASISGAIGYAAHALVERKQLDGWPLILTFAAAGIAILGVFFSPEFEYFKERAKSSTPSSSPDGGSPA